MHKLCKIIRRNNSSTVIKVTVKMQEKDCLKGVEDYNKTGFNYTFLLVNGKYKLIVLYAIYRHKMIRFNEL